LGECGGWGGKPDLRGGKHLTTVTLSFFMGLSSCQSHLVANHNPPKLLSDSGPDW
jgi:hypothetical protein